VLDLTTPSEKKFAERTLEWGCGTWAGRNEMRGEWEEPRKSRGRLGIRERLVQKRDG
jgi:hypothetical protein